MSRILPLPPAQADASTAAALAAVKSKLGTVPNLVGVIARAPAALDGYLALSAALDKGTLTARQREIVALAIAQANACQYCLSAHTLLGKGAGLREDEIAAARAGSAADPLDAAIAGVAVGLVHRRGLLSDEELAAARKAGVNDRLMVEIVANVARNIFTNYLNHVAGTEVDFPVVSVALSPESAHQAAA